MIMDGRTMTADIVYIQYKIEGPYCIAQAMIVECCSMALHCQISA